MSKGQLLGVKTTGLKSARAKLTQAQASLMGVSVDFIQVRTGWGRPRPRVTGA